MAIFKIQNEAPRPDGRGIFSSLLRRERNPTEAKNSSRSFPRLRSWFSAKEDKNLAEVKSKIFPSERELQELVDENPLEIIKQTYIDNNKIKLISSL